jgi:hypothetical protein
MGLFSGTLMRHVLYGMFALSPVPFWRKVHLNPLSVCSLFITLSDSTHQSQFLRLLEVLYRLECFLTILLFFSRLEQDDARLAA